MDVLHGIVELTPARCRVLRLLGWAALCAVSAAGTSTLAAERDEGIAYLRGSDRIAYRETDWLFERGGIEQRLVLYRCANGEPFGRKWVHATPGVIAPDFEFLDARDGYQEGVRTVQGTRRIFVQENARSRMQVRPLPSVPGGVIDAGFDAFVRLHWQQLSHGVTHHIPFLIPSRFQFLDFRIAGVRDALLDGQPARSLKMGLSAWYGFALPSIELTYDPQGRQLEEFQGPGTIRDASGHNQTVRIVFLPQDRHADIMANEITHAAAEPLASYCNP